MIHDTTPFMEIFKPEHQSKIKEAQAEYEKDFRRSFELRSSFYDKLSALSAGSIAVAASVGMALIAKPELRSGPFHANVSWLAGITVFLWVSLISAVVHNFIALRITKSEAEYSNAKARLEVAQGLIAVRAAQQTRTADEEKREKTLFDAMTEIVHTHARKMADLSIRIETAYFRATALGYLAMFSFLTAYTLVVTCSLRLWWKTR
jgi:hypothetical protein